ncbi:MAG: four helix bundle protein [Acidobacteria bacterium]|nr:four helix bundle protein [Acidobacteriota bacterium]
MARASFWLSHGSMGIKRLDDLVAFKEAVAFKVEVYALVRRSAGADRDFRYRDQLFDAASSVEANIAEGWRRFAAPDMIRFLRYATGSLEEARVRLLDGVDRGYFTREACDGALVHAARCGAATTNLIKSLERFRK